MTPSIEEFLATFAKFSTAPIDPSKGLFAQGLDSIHAVEWLYGLEDEYDTELDAAAIKIIENGSLHDLYSHLFPAAAQTRE